LKVRTSQLKYLRAELNKREEISSILLQEINDPRIQFVSVIRVEVSADLQHAKIFVSIIGSDDKKQEEAPPEDSEDTPRDSLEQRRAILQSIKDFDFQIKKNQEELTFLNKKLDGIVKDLDDLDSSISC